MTLMPDADYTKVMTALAGDLAAMPWAAAWHVPSPRVFSAWRQAIGPGPHGNHPRGRAAGCLRRAPGP